MSKKANADIPIFKIYVEEFNTYASQFDEICQQKNIRRLKLCHANITELFKTIKETYYQIVRSNALETSETLFKEYIGVKNRYENFVFQIEKILEVENVSQPVKLEQSVISNVKLPKFNLPVFSGEMSQWLSFKDLFLVTIDKNTNLSDIQKLQYLHSSLKGDAARIIKGFPITKNNYNQAWKTLIERYDNKREIIFSQLDKIFKIKLYKISTSKAMYELLDICNESLRNLETIGLERNEMVDVMLIHFLQKKLDTPIRQQWELSYGNQELPSYQRFISFLEKQAQSLINTMKDTTSKEYLNKRVNTYKINVSIKNCLLCKLKHKLNQCNEFRQMSIQNRIGYVKLNQLCSNCLRGNHSVENCKITNRCFHCNKNHHTLLHVVSSPPRQRESSSVQFASPKSVQPSNVPSTSTSCCLSEADGSIQILLSTAIIHIQDVNGEDQIFRALLDNGSQRSLITEKCAAKLGIPIRRKRIAVGGLGDQVVESSLGEVLIRFSFHFDHQSFETTALVLTKLTNNIPSFTVKKINYSHMKGLILADPSYFKSREIDVILGSDIVFNLIQEGRRNGNENEPSAIHSKLGWLVYGPTSVSERQSFRNMAHFSSELESEDLIKRFWELKSIPLEEIPTKEEKDCESHYLKNVVRDESGRYIVRLPFKESAEKLGQSKSIAIRRFLNLEKRLEQNENIHVQYKQFMNEYIRLGHMKASCSLQTEPKYYIPHHCILKAQPTKLRVVFDASTKTTTQISLNDLLHVGPKLQNNIFNILLKFRTNSVALVADIENMYRQIRLHSDDIKYQTILWRDCKDLELQEYNLTVTYGLACAPYLAIRTLHQIAHEMHGFCDSSELAYSAVCYLRITYENNQIETILLTAKTKVAPIKKITIPRLELCAALMLAQLQSQTTQALPFNIDEQFYWTDSKIVLAWITSESKKWQIFVANRVAKIQDLTAAHSWQYRVYQVKCNSTCVRSVVMKSNREFENRAAIIVALRAGRSPKEIVDFLKLPKTTIYRVKKQFDEADSNKEGIATRKKHSRRSDRVRGEEFVKNVKEKIDGNPGKSMRAIAKEMDVGSMTIVRTIHEDLGLKSYALRKGQLLTENMKNNRKGKAAALLNNLKHDSFGMLRFFSDEKNFDVDQKVNPRNDRWICKDPSEIPVVMHTKFPASVMVLGVISSEGDVMPPHFFEKGLRMNADTYINVLETVVKPWMDMVAAGRKLLNYEELLTLLAQIEACLNSRPLTFVSNDPNDLTALTPGHFLIGNAIRHDAESDHSALNLRSRWNMIQPQRDYFWNRWSCEYLHQLQERRQWRTSDPDVNIGDFVMLKEQNKPLQWKLARIVQIFPGEDDHVRVVLLRTPKGLLKRPITKICPLPYK
ncbi:hypothetical protein LAZ67_18000896, partial [Cordylochernes scorpioides]